MNLKENSFRSTEFGFGDPKNSYLTEIIKSSFCSFPKVNKLPLKELNFVISSTLDKPTFDLVKTKVEGFGGKILKTVKADTAALIASQGDIFYCDSNEHF